MPQESNKSGSTLKCMRNPIAIKDKAALAFTTLLFITFAGPLMWGAISTDAKAATTTYSFETCVEGWTVKESFTSPDTATKWQRQQPGAPAAPTQFSFQSFPYPTGFADDPTAGGGVYMMDLIAPVHTAPGGSIDINFYMAHDMEVPPPAFTTLDALYLEWSSNGSDWIEAKKYTGMSSNYPQFTTQKVTINPPAGPLHLRFRMVSDGNVSGSAGNNGRVAVDEIVLPLDRPAGAACAGATSSPTQSTTATPTQTPTGTPTQTPTATPTPSPSPSPGKCTKSGTNKDDTVRGTGGADVLCGKGGDDTLIGKAGNDVLKGQGGKDTLKGGPGKDRCIGGPGKDKFKGCETKRQ